MELDKLLLDCCKDFEIIKNINCGLFDAVAKFPTDRFAIKNKLDSMFSTVDLTKSFDKKVIIIFDETLFLEVLIELQSWLSSKCCNIKNIVVITTHTIGANDWYKRYLNLFGLTGFKLIEAPLLTEQYNKRFNSIQPYNNIRAFTQLKYYFSYYGGSHGTVERDVLTSMFSTVGGGYVDYMAGFTVTDAEFEGHLEYLTRFVDSAMVSKLIKAKQQFWVNDNDEKIFNEDFSNNGFQFKIDSESACHVIRETNNYTPYSIITEKTIRGFLHQQIPIPLGAKSVEYLTKLGFCMDYDIIDYSYQYIDNHYDRILSVCDQLNLIKQKYTLDDLADYLNDKQDIIRYNYNYIQSEEVFKKISANLLEKLHE